MKEQFQQERERIFYLNRSIDVKIESSTCYTLTANVPAASINRMAERSRATPNVRLTNHSLRKYVETTATHHIYYPAYLY